MIEVAALIGLVVLAYIGLFIIKLFTVAVVACIPSLRRKAVARGERVNAANR